MIVRSKSLYLHQFVKVKLKEAVKIQKSLSVIEVDVFFESTYQIAIIALFFLAGKLKNKSSPMQIYSPVLCWGVFLCLSFSFVFQFCFILFRISVTEIWSQKKKKCRQMYRRLIFSFGTLFKNLYMNFYFKSFFSGCSSQVSCYHVQNSLESAASLKLCNVSIMI